MMKQLGDYAIELASSGDDGPMPPAEIEKHLLDYYCSPLKEKFPAKAYYKKLCLHPPFGGEFDAGDDVIVPFPEV